MKHVATLASPMFIAIPRKTRDDRTFILNLNHYRNTHHFILNTAKQLYKEHMAQQIAALPQLTKVAIRYVVNPKSKQSLDVSNVCSICDKFFMDALVESGKLPDDNYHHYVEIGYKFGQVNKTNPHIAIEIYAVA